VGRPLGAVRSTCEHTHEDVGRPPEPISPPIGDGSRREPLRMSPNPADEFARGPTVRQCHSDLVEAFGADLVSSTSSSCPTSVTWFFEALGAGGAGGALWPSPAPMALPGTSDLAPLAVLTTGASSASSPTSEVGSSAGPCKPMRWMWLT